MPSIGAVVQGCGCPAVSVRSAGFVNPVCSQDLAAQAAEVFKVVIPCAQRGAVVNGDGGKMGIADPIAAAS